MKARATVIGFKDRIEGTVLVDTGASLTLLDRRIAEIVGVKSVGRTVNVVADGHELVAELAILEKLTVEGEELPYAYVAVLEFPNSLRQKLRELSLVDWRMLGLSTLELLQLAPDVRTGTLRKTTAFAIILT